jgi:hypothetical protein
MRIIAAEVAIAPEGRPEVEVGMLPLDLDLPGPCAGMPFGRRVIVRLTLHTSRGDLTINQHVALREEEPDRPIVSLDLPGDQYRALCRSMERKHDPPPDALGGGVPRPKEPPRRGDVIALVVEHLQNLASAESKGDQAHGEPEP